MTVQCHCCGATVDVPNPGYLDIASWLKDHLSLDAERDSDDNSICVRLKVNADVISLITIY